MYILHIETSTAVCSVALSDGPEVLEVIDLMEGMNHTALLTPLISQLLMSTSKSPSDLKAISVGSGPGSYTGLRVGSSTAKAMAYSLDIPLIATPTLLALASGAFDAHSDCDLAVPMLDARRNEVYTAVYDRNLNEIIPPSSLILETEALELLLPKGRRIVFCGEGAAKLNVDIQGSRIDAGIRCSARHLVKPAFRSYIEQQHSDPVRFVPFYLKPPNITQQKKFI